MSSTFDQLVSLWNEQTLLNMKRPWSVRLANGDMSISHYKGFLLETYHNTAYNPQLQAFATMYIKNNPRDIVKKFFLHASSEIAHDLLAKDDLMALGISSDFIESSRPLPTTSAFQAFTIYNIQFKSPLCYLSYLFHLEMSPVTNGEKIISLLRQLGVPDAAFTFLDEHSKVDVGHMKLMQEYINTLVKTPEEFQLVSDALKDCMTLHSHLLEAAYENGEIIFR